MRPGWARVILAVVVVCLAVGGAAFWWTRLNHGQAVPFRTSAVSRGDLLVSIAATGTVEPSEVIDVGAQVAGLILSFGRDADNREVDYGSRVKAGTILARIDDSLYAAQEAEATSQLEAARAALQRAEADREQALAKFAQAEGDWGRAERIGPSAALSETNFEGYRAAFETTRAAVAVAEAGIRQARANIAQVEAVLRRARRNLDYCTIRSPINGVIIDRRVNIGQTVVASLNAPSLFLLAADLKRMQVWVAVNEADIGRIHVGMPVSFTVDAFPGETFRGTVGKVRLNASMSQNVVTYTVEIETDNPDGRLLPYLTANVRFELDRRADVLLAPNAALRWTPAPEQIAPAARDAAELDPEKKGRGKGRNADTGQKPKEKAASQGTLWLVENGKARPLQVQIGPTDGIMTGVAGEGVAEGLEIITGVEARETGSRAPAGANPFVPSFRPRQR